MAIRLILALCLAWACGQAQQPFPMEEIDQIGHMDCRQADDPRQVADLGLARAFTKDCGPLRIEGADDEGKPWTAHMERVGGVGWTRVFTADFDANGRRDLLFLRYSMSNGRCIDELSITTFLFDQEGRPTPWQVRTHGLDDYDSGLLTLVDEDGDGRAEIATSECQYSMEVNLGVNRRLTGIYEASDGRWRPVRPLSLVPYLTRFQQQHPDDGKHTIWLPAADTWTDPHAGWEGKERYIESLSGTGRRVILQFRDGESSAAAAGVVVDSQDSREIFLRETEPLYGRILAAGASVRLLGDGERPALLWAKLGAGGPLAILTARMRYSEVATTSLRLDQPDAPPSEPAQPVEEASARAEAVSNSGRSMALFLSGGDQESRRMPATDPSMTATLRRAAVLSRNGLCFEVPRNVFEEGVVTALSDCRELGALESEATQGKQVWIGGFGRTAWILAAQERTFQSARRAGMMNRAGPATRVEIQELPGHAGDLVAVIPRDRGFLAQWRLGARSWLSLHDAEGEPTSPAIDPKMDGELFLFDEHSGKTCFLRWDANAPVELTCAKADLELVRAE